MITDKKLVLMYEQCKRHKRELDKRRYLLRAFMFMPPALASILIFFSYCASLLAGAAIMIGGGVQSGNGISPLLFFHALAVGIFAAGEVILEDERFISVSHIFYAAAAVVSLILGFLSGFFFFAFCVYDILLCLLNILFKRLREENEMLKGLDGYPHFDITLMADNEVDGKTVPRKSEQELEAMTDDERLMYERDRLI